MKVEGVEIHVTHPYIVEEGCFDLRKRVFSSDKRDFVISMQTDSVITSAAILNEFQIVELIKKLEMLLT